MRKSIWITGVVVAGIIGVAAVAGGESEDATAESKPEPTATKSASPAESQADKFKAFVAKNGTATEKAAAKHVTKVQGASEQNDVLDAPEIFTDYKGGLTGEHASDGKLLASAFADWKDSENGLVTVYDAKGDVLANGQF